MIGTPRLRDFLPDPPLVVFFLVAAIIGIAVGLALP